MENAVRQSHMRTKIFYLLVKWEEVITFITTLCAVSAIILGVVWIAIRREYLLFAMLGSSGCYLIGRKCWKFRD